jgi:cell division protein FtsB
MKERELSLATSKVAEIKIVSGRATDKEINCCLRTGKQRSFGRIAILTILRSLIAAGFVVALAPMLAQADEEERGRDKKIEALEAKLESLQATVSALESQIDTLQSKLVAVQSNHALLLGPFVSVDPHPEIGVVGPNIIFSGANIHIVSGSGATNDKGNPTGLGNLIIGYDEAPPNTAGFPPFNPGDRGGSHNLVIGSGNRFTKAAFGGLVAGEGNTISNQATSVSGGFSNTANGLDASISGGQFNIASGDRSNVSGGHSNTASGDVSSVSGGQVNIAGGAVANIVGGTGNVVGGIGTVVIGGQSVIDNNNNSIAPNPPFP